MQININFIFKEKKFKKLDFIKKTFVKSIFAAISNELGLFKNTTELEFTLLFTNNEEMRMLNLEFLKKDKPTNILSFPDRDMDYRNISEKDFKNYVELGDIALGYDIIDSEANEYGISFENHFTHLLVHAILHLLGYDHEIEEDFLIMKDLEIKILKKLGVSNLPIYAEN
jgi:probable rRNA maturation factor